MVVPVFGQIRMMFKQFCERVLAYVHCFDQPERDTEYGLYTVSLNSSANVHKVVSFPDLSRPIVQVKKSVY